MLKILKYSISCFSKTFYRKTRDCSCKKNTTTDLVFADFDSFKSVSLSPKYKDGITPYFFTIIKNKKKILKGILGSLDKEFGLSPQIGIELEFYLKSNKSESFSHKKIFNAVLQECKKQSVKILDLEEEKGGDQFEIKTYPESDLSKFIKDYEKIKKIIKEVTQKNEIKAIFDAQPYLNDCGSALQLNISLHNKDRENVFIRKYENGEFVETNEMLNSIGGLCDFISEYPMFFSQKKADFARYDSNTNRILHKKGKFVSPVNISWGVNNRTAAIRIPSPKFSSTKEYSENDKQRRIENRVPCANCDITLATIGSLAGIYLGLKNQIIPQKKTFENAYDLEDLEKIEYKTINNSKIFEALL